MALSSPGIGSNLDVNGIVSKLMEIEQRPLALLARKEASYQSKLSAYGALSGALSSFQTSISALADPAKFRAVSASSADSAILSGTANDKAVPGTYAVNVSQLAKAQTIATGGFASITAPIGSGASTTIHFQFGTISGGTLANGVYSGAAFAQDSAQSSASITIDSSNNSLQGIRDAINKANLGVTATIVSDGSATPNHLVLTSNKTGATSSMKISVSGDADIANLMGYDPADNAGQKLTQSTAGQDTLLTVNGIAVRSKTTAVSEAIQGVTMNIAKEGETKLTVARDTKSVDTAINAMVKSYNDLQSTIKSLTSYDAATKEAGLLLGDSTVTQIQTKIRAMLSSASTGLNGSFTSLSQAGISLQKDGTLAVDSGKLQTALSNNLSDIAGLFATFGTATDSLIKISGSTFSTKAGTSDINIASLATQGKLAGSAPAGLSILAGVNDELNVSLDGVTATVKLLPGSYTADSLAAHVQSAINSARAFSGAGLNLTVSKDAGGVLTLTSNRYGSASKVSISGSGAANLLGGAGTATTGTDVAGSIGGIAGVGSGQFLTGAKGSPADGLKLEITGGAIGARGSVTFSQGFAYQLGKLIDTYAGSEGMIASNTKGINASIEDIGTSREALNRRLTEIEKRYRAQYTALDAVISKMTQTSNYLMQQLAQISNNSTR